MSGGKNKEKKISVRHWEDRELNSQKKKSHRAENTSRFL